MEIKDIFHCDLARLHLLHKTCWVDSTVGRSDWTVRVNAFTVHLVPARIMQLLEGGALYNKKVICTYQGYLYAYQGYLCIGRM